MVSVLTKGVARRPAGGPSRRLHVDRQSEFERLVTRHRHRADRSGSPFSLVTFTTDAGGRDLVRLGRIAWERARVTDDVCYLSPFAVCVMLEGSARRGANRFASDVLAQAQDARCPARAEIQTYADPDSPMDHDSPADHDSLEGRHFRDDRTDRHAGRRAGNSPDPGRAIRRNASMQPLLVRPMPAWKRTVDVLGASAGIILAAPLMLALAALIRFTSPGPVFFTQRRAGLGAKPFTMIKFRTMAADAELRKHHLRQHSEQDGPAFKMSNDPRVTRLGRVLRKTSLDELPQLFNVLKGEMSLVGPRPLPLDESNQCRQWHQHRLDVTPGLTCIWQVEGRSRVSFDDWMRMDASYVRRLSFLRDMKIIFKTVPSVLRRRGAV